MAKNLTLAIDEDLLDKARVIAAIKRTSVNELVREYLTHLVAREADHDEATQNLLHLARQSDAQMGNWRPHHPGTRAQEGRFDSAC